MDFIHIIALAVSAIFLFALYFVIRVHVKENQIGTKSDFISDFINLKRKQMQEQNIPLKTDTYFKIMLISPVIIGIVMFLATQNGLFAVLSSLCVLLVPEATARYIKYDMCKKFEERYARSLEQLSSSLRAGLSISQAVEDVAACKFIHVSMRKKYAKLSSDLQMGLTVSEAFTRFADGTNNEDAEDVALAIDIQDTVGGREADVIKAIADDIRNRIMLRREIRSIFSGTSSMIVLMDFITPGIILFFLLTNQEYIRIYFTDPFFTILFVVFIVMILFGCINNHRILRKIRKGA